MILLGLDTVTPQVGCALGGPDGPMASFHAVQGRRHAETLAPAIQFVCQQAQTALDQVDAIAVDVGPGLFTGLRVGLATGKALASALGVPMVGLSSLDLLAAAATDGYADRLVASVVDARRGEVFWALYRRTAGVVHRLTDHAVAPPDVVAAELAKHHEFCLAVGDGARRYADVLADASVEVGGPTKAYPSAAVLVEQAYPLALDGGVPASELGPLYLRKADVRIGWDQRQIQQEPVGPSLAGGEGR
jgi:tRNA threonylcarbamoyladenosine biosynthesis protein TsaB